MNADHFRITDPDWADSQRNEAEFWARQHSEHNSEQFHRRSWYRREFSAFLESLDTSNMTLVDIGSGPEGILHVLNGKRKVAIDPLMNEFRALGYNVEANGVEPLRAVAEALPQGIEADVAFCLNALDHTQEPKAVLREIDRILAPGAWFVMCVDMRPPEMLDCYHKLPLTEATLREWMASVFDGAESLIWLVPHQKPNPVVQFMCVVRKATEKKPIVEGAAL